LGSQEQRRVWDSLALVYFVKQGPRLLVWLFCKLLSLLLFNRFVLWFGGGVPGKQYALIRRDGIPIEQYLGRTVDGERCALLLYCTAPRCTAPRCTAPRCTAPYGGARAAQSDARAARCALSAAARGRAALPRLLPQHTRRRRPRTHATPHHAPHNTTRARARARAGIAEHSHVAKRNYFYYNCLTGRFTRHNCPNYLREESFNRCAHRLARACVCVWVGACAGGQGGSQSFVAKVSGRACPQEARARRTPHTTPARTHDATVNAQHTHPSHQRTHTNHTAPDGQAEGRPAGAAVHLNGLLPGRAARAQVQQGACACWRAMTSAQPRWP
jgi:hypothetical protein